MPANLDSAHSRGLHCSSVATYPNDSLTIPSDSILPPSSTGPSEDCVTVVPPEQLLDLCVPKSSVRSSSHSHSRLGGIRKLLQKHSHQSSRERSVPEDSTDYSLSPRDDKSYSLVRKLTNSSLFRKRDHSNSHQHAPGTPSSTYSAEGSSPPSVSRQARNSSGSRCDTPDSSHSGLFHKLSHKFSRREESNSASKTRSKALGTPDSQSDSRRSTSNTHTPLVYSDLSLGAFEGFCDTPKTIATLTNSSRSPQYSVRTSSTSPSSNSHHQSSNNRSNYSNSRLLTGTSTSPAITSTTTMSFHRRRFHNLPRGSLDAALARGLLVPPSPGPLPALLSNAIEIIPQRLYWMTAMGSSRLTASDTHFFNLDNDLIYEPFFADFGPLNLGHTYRYCELLEEKLTDPLLANKRIVHYTTPDIHKRPNAAYLMTAFCVTILGWSPEAAAGHFERVQPPLLPFRDATYGACSYQLTIMDCAKGLNRAIALGWFNFDTFDINTYEYYERLENGDVNWIIPNKFVAFSGPEGSRRIDDEDAYVTFTPNDYVPIFKRMGVKTVIRLNKKQYDRKLFTSQGIDHIDLYFLDGSCPSKEILYRFIDIAEREQGAIAVHCKAGLGRTGTLIGCYAIKHFGFTGPEWIAWNRICRPGSVLGPQQHFLCEIEKELHESAIPKPAASQSISDANHTDLADLLQEMSLDDRRTAEKGDSGQGSRLVNSKRHVVKPTPSDVRSTTRSNDSNRVVEWSTVSPTVQSTTTNDDDDEDAPASTPAYSRDHSARHPNNILTPTATQSPVTKLPRRVQPDDPTKPVVINNEHLPLLSRSFVNNSVNKSN